MQFIKDEDWFQVVRVTGPAHNLLGIQIGKCTGTPLMEVLPRGGDADAIKSGEICRQVMEGVAEANVELKSQYEIKAIRYISTDTRSTDIYRVLALALLRHIYENRTFRQPQLKSA